VNTMLSTAKVLTTRAQETDHLTSGALLSRVPAPSRHSALHFETGLLRFDAVAAHSSSLVHELLVAPLVSAAFEEDDLAEGSSRWINRHRQGCMYLESWLRRTLSSEGDTTREYAQGACRYETCGGRMWCKRTNMWKFSEPHASPIAEVSPFFFCFSNSCNTTTMSLCLLATMRSCAKVWYMTEGSTLGQSCVDVMLYHPVAD
jgi:hypothetical protein